MKKLILLFVLLLSYAVFSQSKTVEIDVKGVCGMCKARIEKAALKTKGVKYAQWSPETQKLSAIINSKKTNIRTIAINISAVGHQASEFPVDNDVYNSLPLCCQYRDPNAKKMHKMDMKKSKN